MAHHGNVFGMIPPEIIERMKQDSKKLNLGATNQFPDGKLSDNDEGEIQIAITSNQGRVIINFGKPVSFIGFTPEQAILIAESLIKQAAKCN